MNYYELLVIGSSIFSVDNVSQTSCVTRKFKTFGCTIRVFLVSMFTFQRITIITGISRVKAALSCAT